jgi:P27 family predicted phage terminase small subunit
MPQSGKQLRGRKPKPKALQLAEGDTRKQGKRKQAAKLAAMPVAQQGLPECPERLKGIARDAYVFWKEQLELMNLAEMPDAWTLERMCSHVATAFRADEHIEDEGEVIEEPIISRTTGALLGHRQVKNRWVSIRAEADKIFNKFASDFGLSPVSRTRLTIDKKTEETATLASALNAPREKRAAVVQ